MKQQKNQYQTPVVMWTSQWIQRGTHTVHDQKGNPITLPVMVLQGIGNPEHPIARALIKQNPSETISGESI